MHSRAEYIHQRDFRLEQKYPKEIKEKVITMLLPVWMSL